MGPLSWSSLVLAVFSILQASLCTLRPSSNECGSSAHPSRSTWTETLGRLVCMRLPHRPLCASCLLWTVSQRRDSKEKPDMDRASALWAAVWGAVRFESSTSGCAPLRSAVHSTAWYHHTADDILGFLHSWRFGLVQDRGSCSPVPSRSRWGQSEAQRGRTSDRLSALSHAP